MKSRMQKIRMEQSLTLEFVSRVTGYDHDYLCKIEEKSFEELTNIELRIFSKLYGVSYEDFNPDPTLLVVGQGRSLDNMKVAEMLVNSENLSEKDKNAINQLLNLQKAQKL